MRTALFPVLLALFIQVSSASAQSSRLNHFENGHQMGVASPAFKSGHPVAVDEKEPFPVVAEVAKLANKQRDCLTYFYMWNEYKETLESILSGTIESIVTGTTPTELTVEEKTAHRAYYSTRIEIVKDLLVEEGCVHASVNADSFGSGSPLGRIEQRAEKR